MPIAGLVAAAGSFLGTTAGATLAGAAIGAGGSLIAGNMAAKGAKSAANTAADTNLEMFNRNEARLAPFTSTGTSALSQLAQIFGFGPGGGGPNAAAATAQLSQFPGFQFGRDQGVQALDRSAASRGLVRSGAQLQDVQKFGTDYAMQQAWAPYISGLEYASTLGENAAAGTGTLGTTAAGQAGQAQLTGGLDAASAQGNGVANVTNTLQSSLQQYALQHGGGAAGGGVATLPGGGFGMTENSPGSGFWGP
jgi:hypothetical protein